MCVNRKSIIQRIFLQHSESRMSRKIYAAINQVEYGCVFIIRFQNSIKIRETRIAVNSLQRYKKIEVISDGKRSFGIVLRTVHGGAVFDPLTSKSDKSTLIASSEPRSPYT